MIRVESEETQDYAKAKSAEQEEVEERTFAPSAASFSAENDVSL